MHCFNLALGKKLAGYGFAFISVTTVVTVGISASGAVAVATKALCSGHSFFIDAPFFLFPFALLTLGLSVSKRLSFLVSFFGETNGQRR